eukprot:scaffold426_cov319-Pavlova_lutheri.AAC.7
MDSESRWKALCEREFDGKRQQLDAQLPLYDVEWKKMYCKKPRVRFDGKESGIYAKPRKEAITGEGQTSVPGPADHQCKVQHLDAQCNLLVLLLQRGRNVYREFSKGGGQVGTAYQLSVGTDEFDVGQLRSLVRMATESCLACPSSVALQVWPDVWR